MPTTYDSLFDATPSGLTLTQYTQMIGDAVRSYPGLQQAWVMAELSDVRTSGGHCYMELIEKNDAGVTVAKLRATIWQSYFLRLNAKFLSTTGRNIGSGMKVLVRGSATHHSVYGLSFNITDIDPSYTIGDMERLRREILARLQKEGILEANKSLVMTLPPQRIAVISAQGAAGYGDFMNQLVGNTEGYQFYAKLFPAVMQGDSTSASVRAALQQIEMTIDLWDCVVIIRGGGATTDLNGFDDYELAKAVALFPLPIIVGIGHERDRTVLDDIAHTRVKTPTAAAAFLFESADKAWKDCLDRGRFVVRYATEKVAGEQRRLSNAATLVPTIARSAVEKARQKINAATSLLGVVARKNCEMSLLKLSRVSDVLKSESSRHLNRQSDKLKHIEIMVSTLSPEATLRRGYSITRVNGKAVSDVSNVALGAEVVTQLHQGTLHSKVISTDVDEKR